MRWWCGKGECWGDGGVGREWVGTSSREERLGLWGMLAWMKESREVWIASGRE